MIEVDDVKNIVQPISFGTLAFATSEELEFWKRVYVATIESGKETINATWNANKAVDELKKQREVHH